MNDSTLKKILELTMNPKYSNQAFQYLKSNFTSINTRILNEFLDNLKIQNYSNVYAFAKLKMMHCLLQDSIMEMLDFKIGKKLETNLDCEIVTGHFIKEILELLSNQMFVVSQEFKSKAFDVVRNLVFKRIDLISIQLDILILTRDSTRDVIW
jgi:hypothetical protein